MRAGALLRLVALLAACGDSTGGEAVPPGPPAAPAAPSAPPDSLALRTPAGVEVWFTGGRPAEDGAGVACHERSLEIRDSSGRRGVPLLYTLEAPVLLDDTSMGARIYNGCRPGDRYRVSLRTGRPVPMGTP